ncbi:MAG: hypothetical protein EXR75_08295 [Myxococcales bacterium]|nr:hypothetical protein [Myxococcales bacterium]
MKTANLSLALLAAVLAGALVLTAAPEARAQEIQFSGPLAGAPAVRRLRLHREDRFDVAPIATFTLLDEFRRNILFGARATYHFTDSFGVGLFGTGGISYNAGLADELQEKAVDGRSCDNNPNSLACRRTAVSLCRGANCLEEKQLGSIVWMLAPQVTLVPFRGKFSFFGAFFMDSDISLFVGPAIIGLNERAECKKGECAGNFKLDSRVTGSATVGLGFNFYPTEYVSFGAEFRGTPFLWNTSGFDIAGKDTSFPDEAIDGDDQSFHLNPMLSVFASVQLPTEIRLSD